tara:strand:+ start:220 stop:336 length:117 start_codon:yes stop_codon:yes gene_type:complete
MCFVENSNFPHITIGVRTEKQDMSDTQKTSKGIDDKFI